MDKQSISAITVCFLAFIGYEYYLNQKYPQRFEKPQIVQDQAALPSTSAPLSQNQVVNSQAGSASLSEGVASAVEEAQYPKLSSSELTLENDSVSYVFNQDLGAFEAIRLKKFTDDQHQAPMNLLDRPLVLQAQVGLPKLEPYRNFEVVRTGDSLTFSRLNQGWRLSHTISIPKQGYGADIKLQWQNVGDASQDLKTVLLMQEEFNAAQKSSSSFLPGTVTPQDSVILSVSGKTERYEVGQSCKEPGYQELASGQNFDLGFLGFDKHYFLTALLPASPRASYAVQKSLHPSNGLCTLSMLSLSDFGLVKSQETVTLAYKAWFGPKSTEFFGTYDAQLESTLDLGFFSTISHPLLSALHWIYRGVANWGLAIIFLTILLKFLFYPLTRQAAISMNNMKKFQPEMNRIREKFKEDPKRQQQEIMSFMSLHKINPMKGCLPVLPQIPVFFAFYRVLSTSIELRHAPFYGWIGDLSSADPYYVTPLLLGVTMFIQQKLTPTTGMDKTQERIMMILPIMFTAMMLTLPAGMVLYMLTNTIISIGQQQWLNKKLQVA